MDLYLIAGGGDAVSFRRGSHPIFRLLLMIGFKRFPKHTQMHFTLHRIFRLSPPPPQEFYTYGKYLV